MEPDRTEWQVRCAFNAFCKRVLKNEAINIYNERKQRQAKEMTFSDLTPQEEFQLYSLDRQYEGEEGEGLQVAGKRVTPKLLAEAMLTLPIEKRKAVLLYYFFDKSDIEIAELLEIPRSTVQYRRTSSFKWLKRFLEEHADDWDGGLLPYPIILAANKGEPEAMEVVILHYGSYMTSMSMRKLYDEQGNTYWGIDEDTRDRLRSKLMQAILAFKI